MVIAAFNALADRVDALEANGEAHEGGGSLPLTPEDVRHAAEHAAHETRTACPDFTAPWTLHLAPGCIAENTESGNRFAVEATAIVLRDQVKTQVLNQALEMIDPDAKARWEPDLYRTREVRNAVANLQRVLGMAENGLVDRHTVDAVLLLAELAKR
ncbi:hypothetical protein D3272_23590 [Lichenibacterium ramalinae]|uniref:Uncharacterized protein n=2 Tax=Lichenibacterium ramalinae TaxID=2316527 RepID=A0A4Q2RAI9_9HYPH|nr:hypothetical protein D3272_23590 [Lichenibacterium ramalinae]